ncbi:MAG: hypothetical protein AB7O52_01280 [Planctomycetota bacterium]
MSEDKRKKTSRQGGRPRIRQGDEVQVTVEFPLIDYARLSGYVSYRKTQAMRAGKSVWEQSKKHALLGLWQQFWESLDATVRLEIESSPNFRNAMKRLGAEPATTKRGL